MHTSQKTSLGLATLAALGLAATMAPSANAAGALNPTLPGGGASTVNPNTTVYLSRAAFLAALGTSAATSYTNTFTTPSNGQNSSVPYSGNGFTYTATGQGIPTVPPSGGLNDVYVDGSTITPFQSNGNVLFNSNSGNIFAFGGNFYATNSTGVTVDPGQQIQVNLSNGTQVAFTSGADTSDASTFLGFISTAPISQLADLAPEFNTPDYATVDNLTVAGRPQLNAVPEPSSVAAFAFTGLFAAGLILKARKRQSAS